VSTPGRRGGRVRVPVKAGAAARGARPGTRPSYLADEVTGNGRYVLALPLPVARGLEPELELAYHAGGGNTPFGFGWSVAIAAISLDLSFGTPRYDGRDPVVFGDVGPVVPRLVGDGAGGLVPDVRTETDGGTTWSVARYVPRLVHDFTTIERWSDPIGGTTFWLTVDGSRVVATYGRDATARIADPADPQRVADWLLQELRDPDGNRVVYHYRPEDGAGVTDLSRQRTATLGAQRYPASIAYGNYRAGGTEQFACEVIFDYGERDLDDPDAAPQRWPVRADPFSSFATGFELRTLRLCRAILVYHRFPALFGGAPTLQRAIRLDYDATTGTALLSAVREVGFRKDEQSYAQAALPALRFAYAPFEPQAGTFRTLTFDDAPVATGALDGRTFELVDLAGEGLPGIVLGAADETRYWEPLGDLAFGSGRPLPCFPIDRALENGDVTLRDVRASGRLDVAVLSPERAGFYRNDGAGSFAAFQPFAEAPIQLLAPGAQYVDLDGRGVADLLIPQAEAIFVFPDAGEHGYDPPRRVARTIPLAATSSTQLTLFASPFGDGRRHHVCIADRSFEVWPNLGGGRFGAPISLPGAPAFPDGVDAGRLILADLDGTGCDDLLYLRSDRVEIYTNHWGNGFGPPIVVPLPLPFDALSRIAVADVDGSGISSLVISLVHPAVQHWAYRFAPPVAAPQAPHLLVRIDDERGTTTNVEYRSATSFYLADRRAGRPWFSALPVPLQVVARVETVDHITGVGSVWRARYHDGYYDPVERAFAGFGMVERWDAETSTAGGHAPAAYVKTWYETGAELDAAQRARCMADWFAGEQPLPALAPTFDPGVTTDPELRREAHAALRGRVLREETYSADGDGAAIPFSVHATTFHARLLQPRGPNRSASFFTYDRETVAAAYERGRSDPRITHDLVLAVDPLGNVTSDCALAYPRPDRPPPGDGDPVRTVQPEQRVLHATLSQVRFADASTDAPWIGLPCETQVYELRGIGPGDDPFFTGTTLAAAAAAALANPVSYGAPPPAGAAAARLVSWTRTLFWNDAQTDVLPLGQAGAAALAHHEEHAVADRLLVERRLLGAIDAQAGVDLDAARVPAAASALLATHGIRLDGAASAAVVTRGAAWTIDDPPTGHRYLLALDGTAITLAEIVGGDGASSRWTAAGYALAEGYWWSRSPVTSFAGPDRYRVATQLENVFAAVGSALRSLTTYDYDDVVLTVVGVTEHANPQSLTLRIDPDYQALAPARVTDPNGIVTESRYDPLGRLQATSTFKGADGDTPLAYWTPRPAARVEDVVAQAAAYLQGASSVVVHDDAAWRERQTPTASVVLARETHVSDLPVGTASAIQVEIAYYDGSDAIVEHKLPADAGQWRVADRSVHDRKGLPVATYRPYLTATPAFEPLGVLLAAGALPPPTTFTYDALGRVLRRDEPDGSFSRFTYAAWSTTFEDPNDTILESSLYRRVDDPNYPADDRDALVKAAAHANTPTSSLLDPLGRVVVRVDTDRDPSVERPPLLRFLTRTVLDESGNVIALVDPRGGAQTPPVAALRRAFSMDAAPLLAVSPDAGVHAVLTDVLGNVCWERDGRGLTVLREHDPLGRLTATQVVDPANGAVSRTVATITYGDALSDGDARNLRGLVAEARDGAGLTQVAQADLGGRPVESSRRFVAAVAGEPDWSATVTLDLALNVQRRYDAFGRCVRETFPDGRVVRTAYAPSGRLTTIDVDQPGGGSRSVVGALASDAQGRTTQVALGNGAVTSYGYDETTTGRLRTISTARPAADGRERVVHDHAYAYDPVGNLTRARDRAKDVVFWKQQRVEPLSDHTFDARYRLIAAQGRAQPGAGKVPSPLLDGAAFARLTAADPSDTEKFESYLERYDYDDASNLLAIRHAAASGSWTRATTPQPFSNRLAAVDDAATASDPNGNLTAVSHLRGLGWNYRNALIGIATVAHADGTTDGAAYWCDDAGHRARTLRSRRISSTETETVETVVVGAFERTRIVRTTPAGTQTILERTAIRILDDLADAPPALPSAAAATGVGTLRGRRSFATLYRWALDAHERETATPQTPVTTFTLDTLLGSSTIELDEGADVVTDEEYLPYGGTAVFAARSQREGARKRYRFTGAERDPSGLYAMGVRWYAPWLGRWITPDPAGPVDGPNLYLYCSANPVSFVDPTGYGKYTADPNVKLAEWKKKLKSAEKSVDTAERALLQAVKSKQSAKTQQRRAAALAAAHSARRTARGQVTRYTKKAAAGTTKGGSLKTTTAFHNPGGPLTRFTLTTHPGPTTATRVSGKIPKTAYVANLAKKPRSAKVENEVRWYVQLANQYIASRGGSVTCVATNRTTSGSIGSIAGRIAAKERKLANTSTPGTYGSTEIVAHVPDPGVSGFSHSPLGWMAVERVANSIVGGGISAGRVLTLFVVKEQDGHHYRY
jgi:RHS repeat-associated protein